MSHAEQTRRRIRRKQRERERARLLKLGADPVWVERVLGSGDAAADARDGVSSSGFPDTSAFEGFAPVIL